MAVLETEMAKRNKYNLRRQAGLWIAGIVFPGFPVRWPARDPVRSDSTVLQQRQGASGGGYGAKYMAMVGVPF